MFDRSVESGNRKEELCHQLLLLISSSKSWWNVVCKSFKGKWIYLEIRAKPLQNFLCYFSFSKRCQWQVVNLESNATFPFFRLGSFPSTSAAALNTTSINTTISNRHPPLYLLKLPTILTAHSTHKRRRQIQVNKAIDFLRVALCGE